MTQSEVIKQVLSILDSRCEDPADALVKKDWAMTTPTSDTPDTDALLARLRHETAPDWNVEDVMALLKHSRNKERELNEANEKLEFLKKAHAVEHAELTQYKQVCGEL